jgi:fructose-1,6-bisphosphatase/inositol monophosphatase family enzyme
MWSAFGCITLTAVPWFPIFLTHKPIDGTANFVHRIPQVCVSIGLTMNKEPVVGVVYNPIMDELYTATKHHAASLNGTPIRVSAVSELSSACVMVEYGSNRAPEKVELMLTNLRSLLTNDVQCVRATGSCALSMCYVACGRVDSYSEYGPFAWDMAAGAIILRRAGGVLKGAAGDAFSLTGRSLLACAPGLETEILSLHTPRI